MIGPRKVRTSVSARDELHSRILVIQQSFGLFSEAIAKGNAAEARAAADALALHFHRAEAIAVAARDLLAAGEPVWRAEQALEAMRGGKSR